MVRLFLVLCLLGCSVSPQPDPALDVDRIGYTDAELRGEPGSVVPRGAQLYVWPLFATEGPTIVDIERDGSFAVPWTPAEDETRLQVRSDEMTSDVVDIVRSGDRAVLRPLEDCVDIPRVLELSGTVGVELIIDVPVTSDCAFVFEIVPGESGMLGIEPGFMFEDIGLGFDVGPGETLNEIRVFFTPPAAGVHTDRLLIDVGDPVSQLYATEIIVNAE